MDSHLFSINKKDDGVNENDMTGFNVYPNPADGKIFVEGENISVVELYNFVGQKIASVKGTDNTYVDVAAFENGVYLVKVITNDANVTTKKVTIVH